MKNDRFADIAAGFNISADRGLIAPKPKEHKNRPSVLNADSKDSFELFKKTETREELFDELRAYREKMNEFLTDYTPFYDDYIERQRLTDFTFSLDGGAPEKVTVPHYGGPVGEHTAVYETAFNLKKFDKKRVFIKFKAVDYIAVVFVNGEFVGEHEGFFAPFEFDITDVVNVGENKLKVVVKNLFKMQGDDLDGEKHCGDKVYASTGIGWDDPMVGWHHCPAGMGIYNDVLVEIRNPYHITDIFPRFNDKASEIWIECNSTELKNKEVKFNLSLYGQNFQETVFQNVEYSPTTNISAGVGDTLTEASLKANGTLGNSKPLFIDKGYNRFIIPIEIKNKRIWTTDEPYLYKIIVEMSVDGVVTSAFARQFGIRTFTEDFDSKPKGKFYLNGKEIRLRGANTMGFEQQDIFKKDYDRLINDILLAKLCNMNFLRITQRPVQEEFYEYCDKLGLLIQTDMPMFGCVRINKLCEIIKQGEEMEKLIRSHPCCILDTYINEPFPNANNLPHRMLVRSELQTMFEMLDRVVRLQNPDRVTKHVDGDYDPPSDTLPDNHCYPMWYNSHGIEVGKLHKGHWLMVKPGWHYGCGEFGCEGLEDVETMKKYYPKEWLSEPFNPAHIVCEQTAPFHYFFYETPTGIENWVKESQKYQAFATKIMTSAFRRNEDMNTFAIHLFIDAFPAGWMKTIMDCDRNPKPAFFEYKNCLEPVFCNLRSDRFTFFENEDIEIESYLCNDSETLIDELKYMVLFDGKVIYSKSEKPQNGYYQNNICFRTPKTDDRDNFSVIMGAFSNGKLVNYCVEKFGVFKEEEIKPFISFSYEEYNSKRNEIDERVKNGETIVINNIPQGEYTVGDKVIIATNCRMSSLFFVSRDTGHKAVERLLPNDLRYFYDTKEDIITPLIHTTFKADGVTPITITANNTSSKGWAVEFACGEWNYGKGKFVVNQMQLKNKEKNPCAVRMLNGLAEIR